MGNGKVEEKRSVNEGKPFSSQNGEGTMRKWNLTTL